jgi:hypothetical protein
MWQVYAGSATPAVRCGGRGAKLLGGTSDAIGRDYPAPVVDHAQERRRALERYRAAAAAAGP